MVSLSFRSPCSQIMHMHKEQLAQYRVCEALGLDLKTNVRDLEFPCGVTRWDAQAKTVSFNGPELVWGNFRHDVRDAPNEPRVMRVYKPYGKERTRRAGTEGIVYNDPMIVGRWQHWKPKVKSWVAFEALLWAPCETSPYDMKFVKLLTFTCSCITEADQSKADIFAYAASFPTLSV